MPDDAATGTAEAGPAQRHRSTEPERRAAIMRLMGDMGLAQKVQDGLRNHPSLEDIGARTNRFLDESSGSMVIPLFFRLCRAG